MKIKNNSKDRVQIESMDGSIFLESGEEKEIKNSIRAAELKRIAKFCSFIQIKPERKTKEPKLPKWDMMEQEEGV